MTVLETSPQNLSDYIHILLRKIFELNKKGNISSKKMRISCNFMYVYARSFFGNPSRYTSIYMYTNKNIQANKTRMPRNFLSANH